MSRGEFKLNKVPSIEDLEKIEETILNNDKENSDLEKQLSQVLINEYIEQDSETKNVQTKLGAKVFNYRDKTLRVSTDPKGNVYGFSYNTENQLEKTTAKDVALASGATQKETTNKSAQRTYQNTLNAMGIETKDIENFDDLAEKSEQALETISYEDLEFKGETVKEQYKNALNQLTN